MASYSDMLKDDEARKSEQALDGLRRDLEALVSGASDQELVELAWLVSNKSTILEFRKVLEKFISC